MTPVFFTQAVNGIGYPRGVIPARALGADVYEMDAWCAGKRTPEECWEPFRGRTAVFQMVCNWSRLHAMRDYQRIAGPVFLEVDDDYVRWHSAYVRDRMTLGLLDIGTGWVEEDIPEWGHPNVSSPHVHRRAVEEADGVIVSTPYLAAVYSEYAERVFVCRNAVDPADWPAPRSEPDGMFRVLFSASPNIADLRLIRKAMEWAAAQPGVEAVVVGYKPGWKGVRELGWIQDLAEYRQTMVDLHPDVWLRPVETTEFAKSKSDLKILEAAMVGALPIVSSFEPYLGWAGTPVRFAVTEKDWQQQVRWAVRHPNEVRWGSSVVRDAVLRDRGLAAAREDWGKALDSRLLLAA